MPLNSTYPVRWRENVAKKSRKRGVEFVLSDNVTDLEPQNGRIVTQHGKSITADLVVRDLLIHYAYFEYCMKVPTFGSRPNTEVIKSLGSGVLTDNGYVRVKPTLQLVNHPRIFALGDIIDWKEQKQAAKVAGHVSVVANNVLTLVGLESKFKEYKGSIELIALTNGKVCSSRFLFSIEGLLNYFYQNGGSSYFGILWGIILGNWFTWLIKSKSLMVDMTKKNLGL